MKLEEPCCGLARIKNQVEILGPVKKLIKEWGIQFNADTHGVPMLTTPE